MLEFSVRRTANAGVLIDMNEMSILIDGVCEPLFPFLGTPAAIRESLEREMPDVLAFTHEHPDHYDPSYVKTYKEKTLRHVYGPESLTFYELGNGVGMHLITTRHIGKYDISHVSYVIEGAQTVWFMGDAAPLSLKKMTDFKTPDLLIIPFTYAITPFAWRMTKETGAGKILLLHMPKEEDDREGLWDAVRSTVGDDKSLFTLDIGEKIHF